MSASLGYSCDTGVPRPHDLVWCEPAALADDPPAWARACLASGLPAVIRRAPRCRDRLPVGLRGSHRGQRYGGHIAESAIIRRVAPESLTSRRGTRVAAIAAIAEVASVFAAADLCWGISGAVGFELASGHPVCHVASDLDLVVRTPQPMPRSGAAKLRRDLNSLPVRCDVQLETPGGGVALAEWASQAPSVLIKTDHGPRLSSDPWGTPAVTESGPVAAGRG
ncbi:malonate decarboxylase holo-ACP synthase [Salinisphaera sp. T31B1]|uniref:malonate decarboxylase holo-ACP synthase n=1 Tax=Salinisphaera sp. T31B1 TaxID=727963 RepID=UPI0033417DDD